MKYLHVNVFLVQTIEIILNFFVKLKVEATNLDSTYKLFQESFIY